MSNLNFVYALYQAQQFTLSKGVSYITYECPLSKSSYYDYKDNSIHISQWSLERNYEDLVCNHDLYLEVEEVEVYCLLHELGHHLQPDYMRLKQYGWEAEVDAWDRAETILKELIGQVPTNFYPYRDYCLNSHSDKKSAHTTYEDMSIRHIQNKQERNKLKDLHHQRQQKLKALQQEQRKQRTLAHESLMQSFKETAPVRVWVLKETIRVSKKIQERIEKEISELLNNY
jgi:hypothetical protein